jgi:hypothetical protein
VALTGRLTRMDRSFRRRGLRAIILLSVLLLGWIGYIVTFIEREPAHGAPSLDSLRGRALSALRERDAGRLGLLFEDDSVGDSYPADYLARLTAIAPSRLAVRLDRSAGEQILVVVATEASGPACTSWVVRSDDHRWYLDGGATLLAADQCV